MQKQYYSKGNLFNIQLDKKFTIKNSSKNIKVQIVVKKLMKQKKNKS